MVALLNLVFLFSCDRSNKKSEEKNKKFSSIDSTNISNELSDEEINKTAESLVKGKDDSKLNEAQLQVQKLLESCVENDYAKAASTIMYRGKDQSRIGKDSFNYSSTNEAETVKITCEVIKKWLGTSEAYDFVSYKEKPSDFGLEYVVEVMFKKTKLGVNRHFFYLIKTPNKGMLLVNMV